MATAQTGYRAGFGGVTTDIAPSAPASFQQLDIPRGAGGLPGADAAGDVAKGLAGASDAAEKVGLENDALVASRIDNAYQQEVMKATYDGQNGFLAKKGGDTVGLPDAANQALTDIRQKYITQAPNERVAKLFNRSADRTQQGVLETISRHTMQQGQVFRDDQADAQISTASDWIGLNPQDQAGFDKQKGVMQSAALAKAKVEGASPEKLNLILQQTASQAEFARASQLLNSEDPAKIVAGKEYFTAAHNAGVLTLDHVNKLDALEKSNYPKALARDALPAIQGASGDFNGMNPSSIFKIGIVPSESGNVQIDPKTGQPLRSSAGAIGAAQVMPKTGPEAAALAGVPWDPEKFKLDKEYNTKLGEAYFTNLSKKYGDNTMATMAYNAGPGAFEDFMNGTNLTGKNNSGVKLGDPRTGATSMQAFIANFPYSETRSYVQGVQRRAGVGTGKIDLALAMPKSQELEAKYPGAGQALLTLANSQNSEIEKMQAQKNAIFNADFNIAVNRGQKSYADIQGAYVRGDITPEQYTGYVKQLDEVNNNTLKDAAGAARVNAVLGGVGVLDPKKSEDKKAVDANYRIWAQNFTAQNPTTDIPTAQAAQLDLVNKYNMVPETMQSALRGGLRSSDPAKKVQSADMIDKLRQKNPALLNDFAEEDIKDAISLQAYAQAGYKPEAAAQMLAEQQKMTPEVKKVREEGFKDLIKATPVEGTIRSALTSWNPFGAAWGNSSVIPAEMQGDFQKLAQAEYVRTGNIDSANKVATTLLQKSWSPTNVGGFSVDEKEKRGYWMKNPPEKFYAAPEATFTPAEQSAWMREQLLHDVNTENTFSDKKFKDGELTLVQSPHALADGRPTYNVYYKRDGVINVYGGPDYTWHPEWESSRERKALMIKGKIQSVVTSAVKHTLLGEGS